MHDLGIPAIETDESQTELECVPHDPASYPVHPRVDIGLDRDAVRSGELGQNLERVVSEPTPPTQPTRQLLATDL